MGQGADADQQSLSERVRLQEQPSLRERVVAAAEDRMPPTLRTARLAPTARAAAALAVVGLVAALLAAVTLMRSRPHDVRVPVVQPSTSSTVSVAGSSPRPGAGQVPPGAVGGPQSSASTQASTPASTPALALLVVDVVGPVRRPGVIRLPPGSRVVDALAAAGGLKPGASSGMLNLAAVLTDGQQIVVGGPPPPFGSAASSPPAGAGPAPAGAGVDLNTATVEQLDELPGVGPVLAQRILDWRSANGRFTSIDQLAEVGGIGQRKLADLRKLVRL